jgi:omega-amidase
MSLRVSLLQYDITWEDKSANMEKIKLLTEKINSENTDWLLLPEMSLTGFSMKKTVAEINRTELDFFKELARTKSVHITFGGVFDSFNKSLTIDNNGFVIDDYSKIHLFSLHGEDRYYKRGTESKSFTIKDFTIMPSICYDLRFSYLYWDFARRTDLFFAIANWPASRSHQWKALLTARAVENQAFMVGVNRIGADPTVAYSGSSMVVSPHGEILLDAALDEGVFTVEINREDLVGARKKYPFLKDRMELSDEF